MRKFTTIAISLILSLGLVSAQNEQDALRYNQLFPIGTARTVSMGGAFGAFGGDFSTLSINPAGLGVYRSSEFTFSPGMFYSPTTSHYLGNTEEDMRSSFVLGNFGLVVSQLTGKDRGLVAINFGVGYNRTKDFNGSIIMGGINNNGSMIDDFADAAYGNSPGELSNFYEGLAYDTYLIDEIGTDPSIYGTVLNGYTESGVPIYGLTQRREVITEGHMGEYVISLAANVSNILYIGGNFGIHKIDYLRDVYHSEYDDDNLNMHFDNFKYNEYLHAQGKGYSFDLGFIMKPIQLLRFGAAIHFPFHYKIHEDYSTSLESHFITPDPDGNRDYSAENWGEYDYRLDNPMKVTASAGIQLFKLALISADVEYLDYSNMRFRRGADGYDFAYENDNIVNVYRPVFNIKTGAEFRVSHFSLRAGAFLNQSPYEETEVNKDAYVYGYSAGFGFRETSFFFDMAYRYSNNQNVYSMYKGASLSVNTLNRHLLMTTIGLKF